MVDFRLEHWMEKDGRRTKSNVRQLDRSSLFTYCVGAISGAAWQLNSLAATQGEVDGGWLLFTVAVGAIVGTLVFMATTFALTVSLAQVGFSKGYIEKFRRISAYSYVVFLIFVLGSVGLVFGKFYVLSIVLVWLFLQFLIGIFIAERAAHENAPNSLRWITFLFVISGFAALIYQVVWQRVLFTALGVNMESITLIVSIFMFGLGVGSFVGGQLSMRFPTRLPLLFVVCEISIGVFGLVSVPLIKTVGSLVVDASIFSIAGAVYLLLMVPTMLMGATLPILVKYLHIYHEHVGQSVGNLYWINTIGSAFACFLTVDLLFRIGGLQTSIWVAAGLNIAIGFVVYAVTRKMMTGVTDD